MDLTISSKLIVMNLWKMGITDQSIVEFIMKICTKGTVAHLQGDLTHTGVTNNIADSLAVALQIIVSGGDKYIHIDCERIRSADISGLQLLYVWMQCARFRGVEPALVNLSDSLRQTIQRMGFGHCFTGNGTHPEALALFPVL
jgi:anti-anti-sigma regulatory factor